MWENFSALLNPLSLTIICIIAIIAIVIIALRGKLAVKIGNKTFNLGGKTEEITTSSKGSPPSKVPPIKRTCGDCILLLMGEREKSELKMRREVNKIMKTQMTFAEQKIIEMQTKVSNNITEAIHQSIKDKTTTVEESIQYKLIYSLLKDALLHIKDEVRRSFKENGFYAINGSEFSWYVKERTQVITSMLTQYMQNIYPNRGGVLKLQEILKCLEKESTFLAGIITDMYSYAREVRLDCDNNIDNIKVQFGKWVDSFIQ